MHINNAYAAQRTRENELFFAELKTAETYPFAIMQVGRRRYQVVGTEIVHATADTLVNDEITEYTGIKEVTYTSPKLDYFAARSLYAEKVAQWKERHNKEKP